MSPKDINARGYVHPNVLVSTEWVAENLNNPNVRLIESNEEEVKESKDEEDAYLKSV